MAAYTHQLDSNDHFPTMSIHSKLVVHTFTDGHFMSARLEVSTFPCGDGQPLKKGHDLVPRVAS